jgi:polar amino acid transport system substrate-binding protein
VIVRAAGSRSPGFAFGLLAAIESLGGLLSAPPLWAAAPAPCRPSCQVLKPASVGTIAGMARPLALLATAVLLAGCGLPRDPGGTLARVEGGTLRAGVTDAEPWARTGNGTPTGVEVALVERFAEELSAQVEWIDGSEAELMEALHVHELDVVVGGLTADTPWQREGAVTRPYLVTRTVVAVQPGASLPPDLEGVEIAVENGHPAAAWLERRGAVPVRVDSLADAGWPAAADDWLLDDLGLAPQMTLAKAEHVLVVPLGENVWQVRLERFLFANQEVIEELLARERSS